MFPNLKAEMARNKLTNDDLARVAQVDRVSISNKINCKTEWTRREMVTIKYKLFPQCSLEYLFFISE